ncbi:MAG: efflux RND transporter permease subunit [Phycisphaerae bacterium]|nr:efflux RND transporter permease subunit [Phycisphaerae bacterium]
MLRTLVEFSIRFRGAVIALACVVLGYGIYTTMKAKLDVFPDFVPPQATIQTEAPGLSPEQVESLVTRPVEDAVNGVGNLESVRSQSIQGLSIVAVVFEEGTDLLTARQMLSERLTQLAGELPLGVEAPKMTPLTSATMDLLKIGLVSEKLTPLELRTFADWTLRPRLLSVPGVADVSVFGGEVRQFQIRIKPERLMAYHLAVSDVLAAARKATGVRGAGYVETEAQRIVLRTAGQSLTAEALGEAVVAHEGGNSVRLKDVASVVDGFQPKLGDATIQGGPGVLVKMLSQYGTNTMEVTQSVEEALEEMKPALEAQGIRLYPRLHRPATFIEIAIHNIRESLFIGAILVTIVLFLFLMNLRTAFISMTAIPLSLLTAIIILDRLGATLNTITLGGLAIAIGEVVDDAIIDVENIFRRLRENQTSATPKSVFRVVLDASIEVRSAVVYATFIVVMVFVPVVTMSGLQGRMFAPLGVAYILAVLASLFVALTVTPALSALLLPKAVLRKPHEPALFRRLKAAYHHVLARLARRPKTLVAMCLALFVGAVSLIPGFGGEFLPEFREGHFVVQVSAAPGTSLPEMIRIGRRISEDLLKNPNIDTVEQQVGRSQLGEDPWGPHRSEFHVELKAAAEGQDLDQEAVQHEIRDLLAKYPGIRFEVLTFLGDRISESISGETASVVISVYGEDLEVLDREAEEISQIVGKIKGAADVRVSSPPGAPEMLVQLRPERLKQFGFQTTDVLEAVETAYQGSVAAQAYEGNRVYEVVAILDEQHRRDPEDIGSLLLRGADGATVPLRELADIMPTTGRYTIIHDGARRRQAVTCNVEGRDVESFVQEAKEKVARNVRLAPGTYYDFSGEAETRAEAFREILLHSAIAGVAIVLLLSTIFTSRRNLALVLVNVPFALVGGVLAVYLTGGQVSVGSLVGFVTLFGITMRNSVMMVSHFEHLVAHEGMVWGSEAALRGAGERLIPIVMTALVTGLGLLPIAVGTGQAGREIEGPMAIVIVGGLATSTLLNLLVLPTLALWFGRFEAGASPAEARVFPEA